MDTVEHHLLTSTRLSTCSMNFLIGSLVHTYGVPSSKKWVGSKPSLGPLNFYHVYIFNITI